MMLLKSVNYNMREEYGGVHSYDVVYEFRPTNDQRVNGMTMTGVNRSVCEDLLESEFGITINELKEAFPEKFI
jgi:hypothetical protein